MANVNSVQKAANLSGSGAGAGNDVKCAFGTYEIATALSSDDTITMFTLPAGATVICGWLQADDLDTNMTETIELDVGTGATASGTAADPDKFLNSGALNGDAVTNVLPEGGIRLPLFGVLKDGPWTATEDTDVVITVTAAAATGGTGTVTVTILYLYNSSQVSPFGDAPV